MIAHNHVHNFRTTLNYNIAPAATIRSSTLVHSCVQHIVLYPDPGTNHCVTHTKKTRCFLHGGRQVHHQIHQR